jgi:hypothetical protein
MLAGNKIPDARVTVHAAEAAKILHYEAAHTAKEGVRIVPVAMDIYGGCGPSTYAMLEDIFLRRDALDEQWRERSRVRALVTRLNVALARANHQRVLRVVNPKDTRLPENKQRGSTGHGDATTQGAGHASSAASGHGAMPSVAAAGASAPTAAASTTATHEVTNTQVVSLIHQWLVSSNADVGVSAGAAVHVDNALPAATADVAAVDMTDASALPRAASDANTTSLADMTATSAADALEVTTSPTLGNASGTTASMVMDMASASTLTRAALDSDNIGTSATITTASTQVRAATSGSTTGNASKTKASITTKKTSKSTRLQSWLAGAGSRTSAGAAGAREANTLASADHASVGSP